MKNLSISFISTSLRIFLGVGSIAIFSHALPLNIFSYLVSGLIISQISMLFIDSGINNEILRFGRGESEKDNHKRLRESTAIRLILGTGLAFFFALIVIFTEQRFDALVFIVSFLSGVLASIIETKLVNHKTKNEFELEIRIMFFQVVLVCLLSLLSFVKYQYCLVSILAPRLIVFVFLFKNYELLKQIRSIKFISIKQYYLKRKYYSLDAITSNMNLQLDSVLLMVLFGREAFAVYQPLNRLYLAVINLSSAVSSYFIPKASENKNTSQLLATLFWPFFLMGGIMSLFYYFLTPILVNVLFGIGFKVESTVIMYFSWLILTRYVCASVGASLMLLGFQRFRANVNFVTTVSVSLLAVLFCESYESILLFIIISQLVTLSFYIFKVVSEKRRFV